DRRWPTHSRPLLPRIRAGRRPAVPRGLHLGQGRRAAAPADPVRHHSQRLRRPGRDRCGATPRRGACERDAVGGTAPPGHGGDGDPVPPGGGADPPPHPGRRAPRPGRAPRRHRRPWGERRALGRAGGRPGPGREAEGTGALGARADRPGQCRRSPSRSGRRVADPRPAPVRGRTRRGPRVGRAPAPPGLPRYLRLRSEDAPADHAPSAGPGRGALGRPTRGTVGRGFGRRLRRPGAHDARLRGDHGVHPGGLPGHRRSRGRAVAGQRLV
ncbi:MAG: Transcriptional regulator, AraC family, partial [uncultured Thermomicrobiales bacterium]